jgi:hypothetical protein
MTPVVFRPNGHEVVNGSHRLCLHGGELMGLWNSIATSCGLPQYQQSDL